MPAFFPTYRFFDQYIQLHTTHQPTLQLFDAMYRHFQCDAPTETPITVYQIQAEPELCLITATKTYTVKHNSLLPAIAHGVILRQTLAKIRSHILCHAAVLSYNNQGYIIVADSGCGKTTLSLALVKQGFKLLSDEMVAISLATGELTPYPRCLWVRTGTQSVFQQNQWEYPPHQIVSKSQNRQAIQLTDDLLGKNCPPTYLIVLQTPPTQQERLCRVTLLELPEHLLAELEEANCIVAITYKESSILPVLHVHEAHLQRIYDICDQHETLILNVEQQSVSKRQYQQLPILQKTTKLTGLMELLRAFLGGHRSAVLELENDYSHPIHLLAPLTRHLMQIDCYQLQVGQLAQMVKLIHDLPKLPETNSSPFATN
ncbi:serine kinase of the HPr protein, regulates carbohydrate metabolism [Beggiatoa alba B18LD]|uniref:Serine kinase of the HPr protein, regulates carbohydrate metabolism n=1 Tax=Beggiatoa alba B18LD TaxID=395493 RepID=I3CJR7_9GAMM|nr:hypothetical protein [Beggiatoa alba]EIJ43860.1 serine kinase of the HPr protein, regulates carbohydrate metabolism [Beggiatoa alba B18LD]